MKRLLIVVLCMFFLLGASGCGSAEPSPSPSPSQDMQAMSPSPSPSPVPIVDGEGQTVETRFRLPAGYVRLAQAQGSFGAYLRNLPMKPDGTIPQLFDATPIEGLKTGGVLDVPIGARDSCQTSDAMLKLRAEYLYAQGRQGEIAFHFLSGFKFEYSKWAEGYTIRVDKSDVEWAKTGEPDDSEQALDKYLHMLFAYSNPQAVLSDVQTAVDPSPGDIFVEGGSAIIADMAENKETGEIIVLLCAGGSPAQDLYILDNPKEPEISPWFSVSSGGVIYTDTGSFVTSALMRFK